MTKEDLVREAAEAAYIPLVDVKSVCEASISVITNAIARGEEITIRGLGTLKVVTQKPKKARDITRGKIIDLPARKSAKFVMSKKLRKAINNEK